MPTRPITVVAREHHYHFDWLEDALDTRIAFLDAGPDLRLSIDAVLNEPTLDVARLIIDDAATADVFLEILAALPAHFSGDVLRIDGMGCGFLSATGRGGDRLLYSLRPHDVRFYLYAHGLVRTDDRELLELIA